MSVYIGCRVCVCDDLNDDEFFTLISNPYLLIDIHSIATIPKTKTKNRSAYQAATKHVTQSR